MHSPKVMMLIQNDEGEYRNPRPRRPSGPQSMRIGKRDAMQKI